MNKIVISALIGACIACPEYEKAKTAQKEFLKEFNKQPYYSYSEASKLKVFGLKMKSEKEKCDAANLITARAALESTLADKKALTVRR